MAPLLLSACGKSVGETVDDATITTRVKTSLLNDPDVGGLRIDVDTFKGVVTLSGAVKTQPNETRPSRSRARSPASRTSSPRCRYNPRKVSLNDVKSEVEVQVEVRASEVLE